MSTTTTIQQYASSHNMTIEAARKFFGVSEQDGRFDYRIVTFDTPTPENYYKENGYPMMDETDFSSSRTQNQQTPEPPKDPAVEATYKRNKIYEKWNKAQGIGDYLEVAADAIANFSIWFK